MRIPRIYTSQPLRIGADVLLPEQAGEHVARVLRLQPGDAIIMFNGDGIEYPSTVKVVAKRNVTARVSEAVAIERESPLHVTLVQGVARGDKMDWIVQKATELGVAHIVPIITERTEVKLDEDRAERRSLHWHQVIAAACEQSGRVRLPAIQAPQKLDRWLGSITDEATLRLALLPNGTCDLRDFAQLDKSTSTPSRVLLCVGPEGGFSDKDAALLQHAGFHALRLGPRILRTETAGLAAIAALQTIAGDF